jgi:hypothetical protein
MNKLKQLMAMTAAVLALSLDGKALAQTQAGADNQNTEPQDFEQRVQQFQNMNTEQQQAALQQFQNMDPQQQQAEIQQFRNLDPQLQQDVMQQVQNVVPQPQQNDMQQFQGMDPAEFQNMDPQQMQDAIQQRVDESLREQMGVTNDADWSLIEEKINAVTKARAVVMADSGIGRMMGMGGMRGGRLGGGGGFQAMFGQPSPESQALQQSVDSDAPAAQIRDLLTKFRAAHKEKQAALVKAQDDLRSVLTIRQEGIALLRGLLD